MPQTLAIGALVLSAVLILIAVLGGRFKIFGVEIQGTSGRVGRIIAGFAGLLILVGLLVNELAVFPQKEFASPPQPPEPTPLTKKPKKIVPGDIAKKTRENWLFGNYNDALDGFADIKQKSDDPTARKLAETRLKWLEPYRGRIIFADDFEVDTLKEGIWGIHPGHPRTEGSIFKRVQIDGNSVFEGYGHYHAVAQRVLARFEKGDITANFEIHLKFYPVNPLKCGAHINTILDPQEGRFTVRLYMAEKRLGLFEKRHGQPIVKEKTQVFDSRWYNLRITVQGRHVQIFLDDRLMLDYESPSSQPLLKNLNLETLTETVRFDDVLVITR